MPLMKCGHAAQGVNKEGSPVCVICAGLTPLALEVDDSPPGLFGRIARCHYYGKSYKNSGYLGSECNLCREEGGVCECEEPSSVELAFFEYKPDEEYDVFYCGCHSWN